VINEKDKYATLTDFLNIHSLKEVDGFNPILLRIDRVLCNDPSVLGDIRLSLFDRACLNGLRDWVSANPSLADSEANKWSLTNKIIPYVEMPITHKPLDQGYDPCN
jgi:hypothetical protein|tara:strand:- start:914 stop:1231 length:318 start_codon:yes stop_codon:yes gene_type:complete